MRPSTFLGLLVLLLVGSVALHAGPLGEGTGMIRGSMSGMGTAVAARLSPLMLAAGALRAGWAAAHGQEFTRPLVEAICGYALMQAV